MIKRRIPIASSARRIQIFFLVTAVLISLLAGRAIQVQGLDSSANAAAAAEKMTRKNVLIPQRGDITDRNGVVLATSLPAVRVIADPSSISTNGFDPDHLTEKQKEIAADAPQAIAEILANHLGGRPSEYLPQLTNLVRSDGQPNQYEIIAKQVPTYTYQLIMNDLAEGGWYGLYKEDNPIRYYPGASLAANVLGFVNFEGVGAGGFELKFDGELRGIEGLEIYQSSAYGRIPLANNTMVPAVDGNNYRLTIDSELQYLAQRELENAVYSSNATSGSTVVMNVKTGEILALATAPTFDSNNAGWAEDEDRGNRAVSEAYEPGSVQKVLTFAALLDQGLITPDTPVEVAERIASGGGYINDAWAHGTLNWTARAVLAESSNVGTVQLTRMLDKATLEGYLRSFGLGSPTGIELPGEGDGALGIVPDSSMPDYTRDQISFGQGISVTAVQMAAVVSSVVNGGVYHQPTILAGATDGAGNEIEIPRAEPNRVISEEASADLRDMMEATMTYGTNASRGIPGYRTIGKSGTAQRIDRATGRYLGYTASFVVAAPAEDPTLLVYTVVDNPTRGTHEGTYLALPVSKAVMTAALPRYGIEPTGNIDYTGTMTLQP